MLTKFETKSNRVKGLSFHPKRYLPCILPNPLSGPESGHASKAKAYCWPVCEASMQHLAGLFDCGRRADQRAHAYSALQDRRPSSYRWGTSLLDKRWDWNPWPARRQLTPGWLPATGGVAVPKGAPCCLFGCRPDMCRTSSGPILAYCDCRGLTESAGRG